MARQVLQQDKRARRLTQTPGKLMMSLSLPAIVGMAVIGLIALLVVELLPDQVMLLFGAQNVSNTEKPGRILRNRGDSSRLCF